MGGGAGKPDLRIFPTNGCFHYVASAAKCSMGGSRHSLLRSVYGEARAKEAISCKVWALYACCEPHVRSGGGFLSFTRLNCGLAQNDQSFFDLSARALRLMIFHKCL